MNGTKSLSLTKWNCIYHIILAPKFRRKVFFGKKRVEEGKIIRKLYEWKDIKINRSGNMPVSCAYIAGDTAESGGVELYEVSQRQK